MRIKLGALARTLEALAGREKESVGFILGLRAGDVVECRALFRVDNISTSASLFEADPWQTVQAHRAAESYGLEVVALFHTHTSCPPSPSRLDYEGMARWPIPWVISCPGETRAWVLREGRLEELLVE